MPSHSRFTGMASQLWEDIRPAPTESVRLRRDDGDGQFVEKRFCSLVAILNFVGPFPSAQSAHCYEMARVSYAPCEFINCVHISNELLQLT
jgi:hypothetical protein